MSDYLGNVTALLNEIPSLMSAIYSVAIATAPILMLFVVLGFVTGMFNGILGKIKGKF